MAAAAGEHMRRASEIVLSGFELRTDAQFVPPGHRLLDDKHRPMWETVVGLLDELELEQSLQR